VLITTRYFVLCTLLALSTHWLSGPRAFGQVTSQEAQPLWPDGAPGALGNNEQDIPTITPYYPEKDESSDTPRPAIVIFPGGGYGGLAEHEGRDYAQFLNQQGLAAFVVKYRLGSAGYRHPIMIMDAARAVRWVRYNAEKLGVDPRRIGVMGSSAGGHLTATLLTRFDPGDIASADSVDRVSSRPDIGILCYPVITMGQFTHLGSKRNLLGERPTNEMVEALSNEKQVQATTPPVFVWHTWEDQAVPVENALMFATALRQEGVTFDLHIYTKGRHGIGLNTKPPEFENPHPWTQDLLFWLKAQGFLAQPEQ